MKNRLLREEITIKTMINLYCKYNHKPGDTPCRECSLLTDYALQRIHNCKFNDKKPVCAKCKIHCYKPEMREKIKKVMRFSGPKLILRHPLLSISHLVDSIKY